VIKVGDCRSPVLGREIDNRGSYQTSPCACVPGTRWAVLRSIGPAEAGIPRLNPPPVCSTESGHTDRQPGRSLAPGPQVL